MAEPKPPEPKKPEEAAINSEKGYEVFVKDIQYYLLYVLPDILKQAREYKKDDVYRPLGDLTLTSEGTGPEAVRRLKRMIVNDTNANSSLAAALARTSNTKIMRRIPPALLSALVPMIKVYKVTYPEGIGKGKKEIIYEVPFDDGIYSMTSNSVDSPALAISAILAGRKGGLDLANLVSFDYQYIGTNPAETETSITAKMKLKFQTIDGLLDTRILKSDLPGGPEFKFNYADLVNQAKRIENPKVQDPVYYRLKVKVGYRPITDINFIKQILTPDMIYLAPGENYNTICETFQNAINESNMVLYVYPVRHDLSFNDNGSIDLTIDFHGAIETSLTSKYSNVLLTSTTGKQIINDIKALEKKKEDALKDFAKKAEEEGRQKDDAYEEQRSKKAEEFDKQIAKKYEDNKVLYASFIDAIFNSGKIRKINYSLDAVGLTDPTVGAARTTADGVKKEGREKATAGAAIPLGYETVNDIDYINKLVADLKSQSAARAGNPAAGDAAKSDGKEAGPAVDLGRSPPRQINFMFLQDLIQIGISTLEYDEMAGDDMFFVLGNMSIPTSRKYGSYITTRSEYTQLFQTPNVLSPDDSSAYLFQYNIGMLPISIDYFNKWFFETVVKPGKVEWKLKNFIFDVVELVRVATNKIFGTQTKPTPGSRVLLSSCTVSKEFGEKLYNERSNDINFLSPGYLGNVAIKDLSRTSNILYIYVPTLETKSINPLDVASNDENNVFTFTVGSNAGLMKKISYKKQEVPGMREARATQEGELATGTFRMKYDADIDMYGPCYFRPGDVIVINPVFYSKSSTEETVKRLANELGLGGVFMVLKTNTDLSRDGITTKLDTVFLNYGTLPITKPDVIRPSK